MSNVNQFVTIVLQILMRHMIPICLFTAAMGFILYLAGGIVSRFALSRIAEGKPVDWPYRYLSLGFQIAGVMVLIICFVLLLLLGAYEPFLNLLRGF